MVGFNFADNYRAAGLMAGSETLRMREAPFEKLRQAIDSHIAIDLTRLYFGLPIPRGTDWFRDAFGATDASFSLIDNAREAAVLAAGLLDAATTEGKVYAALATLTTSAGGHRQPLVRPDLIDKMRFAIQEMAASVRQQPPPDLTKVTQPAQSKISAELTALVTAPDPQKASTLLNQVSEYAANITNSLASQVVSVVQPLAAQVVTLREEVEMLWWHVGGWSRMLDKPFTELELGLAAVLAGFDMADMSRSATGPVAAPAVLQRTLAAGGKDMTSKIAIKDAIDPLPREQLHKLNLADALNTIPETCPILTAFVKVRDIGAGPVWHDPFNKATGLEVGTTFSPVDLAMQAYRERLLLRTLA